jgi:hypothetical protein
VTSGGGGIKARDLKHKRQYRQERKRKKETCLSPRFAVRMKKSVARWWTMICDARQMSEQHRLCRDWYCLTISPDGDNLSRSTASYSSRFSGEWTSTQSAGGVKELAAQCDVNGWYGAVCITIRIVPCSTLAITCRLLHLETPVHKKAGARKRVLTALPVLT